MADPATLTALNPREAVADALYRCLLGIDSNNRDLFESGCLKDENMSVVAGPIELKGFTAINDFFERVFHLITTHITSNLRIELKDGADTASLTCHAIAYHVREENVHVLEDTSYTAYNLYYLDLVKDSGDGLWKIKRWEIKVLRTTGDRKVVHP